MSVYFPIVLMLFSGTSMRAAQVLVALYALHLGAQPFAVGVLAATYSIFPMFLSWPVGKLSDRVGSRWPLLFGAICGFSGMLALYYFPGMPALYIASAMYGLGHAFSNVCLQNLVGLLSTPENRAKNYSNYSLATSVAVFVGPLVSGFSIDHSGYRLACLNVALISLIPSVLLVIWGGALPKGSGHFRRTGNIRELLTGSGLWRVLVTCCLLMLGTDLFQFYMPIYGHSIGLSASTIGVILATFAVSAFIVRLVIPYLIKRFSEETILASAFSVGMASLLLVPFFTNVTMLVLISFVFGLGVGSGQPITLMQTFSTSVEGRSGEAMGLRVTANQMTRVVVPVVFGSIGSMFGLFAVFWGSAVLLGSGVAFSKPRFICRAGRTPSN